VFAGQDRNLYAELRQLRANRINDSVDDEQPAGNMVAEFLLCAGAYQARGHDAYAVSSDRQVE
jgi:hypothetical protein